MNLNGLTAALALLASMLSFISPQSVAGQRDAAMSHVDSLNITLVLGSRGGPPSLMRRANIEPYNVILLDSTTVNEQVISDAVFSLLLMEVMDPGGQRRNAHAAQRVSLDVPHPLYPWAAGVLNRLRSSEMQPIPGVGRRRSVSITVPRLRGYRQ